MTAAAAVTAAVTAVRVLATHIRQGAAGRSGYATHLHVTGSVRNMLGTLTQVTQAWGDTLSGLPGAPDMAYRIRQATGSLRRAAQAAERVPAPAPAGTRLPAFARAATAAADAVALIPACPPAVTARDHVEFAARLRDIIGALDTILTDETLQAASACRAAGGPAQQVSDSLHACAEQVRLARRRLDPVHVMLLDLAARDS